MDPNAANDDNFIDPAIYQRLYQYFNLDANIYDADPNAEQAMQQRIANTRRWNPATGGPHQCNCIPARGERGKCGARGCENKIAGYECMLNCNDQGDGAKCKNRPISNEDFNELFDIRACPEPERRLGIYAKTEIPTGTYLGEVFGVLGMGQELPGKWAFPVGEIFRPRGAPMLFLDTQISGNEFRFINTHCVTNTKLVPVAIKNELHLGIQTTKKVNANEEILLEYPQEMLDFVQVHPCNKRTCLIRRNMQTRPRRAVPQEPGEEVLAQDAAPPAAEPAPPRRRRRARQHQDPLDDLDARLGFRFPGLGPIRGVGQVRARARRPIPFDVQIQRLHQENEQQRDAVLAEIGDDDEEADVPQQDIDAMFQE